MRNAEGGRRRAVLVTGSSSGIGRATALRLVERGFLVFATVRKEEDRLRLESLDVEGLEVLCPVDLREEKQIESAVAALREGVERKGARLAAVVNNAGGGKPAPIELLERRAYRDELLTRLAGPVALVQASLPLLRRDGGRIVWIATPAIIPTPYVASIHSCDFAANCLARTLDLELARWKIPSIMVRCGGVETPAGLRTSSDVEGLLASASPEGRALYEGALSAWAREMEDFDKHRVKPEIVAETVLRAIEAPRPRRRYSVGYMASLAAFLETLPQPLADRILKRRFATR